MKFPENLNFKPLTILKIVGLLILIIVVLALGLRLIGSSVKSILQQKPSTDYSFDAGLSASPASYSESSKMASGLSVRNVASSPTYNKQSTGDTAEAFEVTEYSAYIESRNLNKTCEQIANLKARTDIIFENSNLYESSCNYKFKVKKDSVPEILKFVEELNPRDLNQNSFTIKNLIDDYTGEVAILENKLKTINETMNSAIKAYDQISALATSTQDVESLAKIIDSKINLIERLTQDRININSQIERLTLSKAEQLDRLDYTYFNVNVTENKFIDWQNIKDSWKQEIKSFFQDINGVLQAISINLVAFIFFALQYALYFFLILIAAKYAWQLAKYLWRK